MDFYQSKCIICGLVLIILIACFTKTAQASTVQCAARIYFQVTPTAVNPNQQITISGWVQSTAYTPAGSGSSLAFGSDEGWCNILGGTISSNTFHVAVSTSQALISSALTTGGLYPALANTFGFLKNANVSLNRFDNTTQYPFGSFTLQPSSIGYRAGSNFTIYARVFAMGGLYRGGGPTYQTLTDAGPVTIQVTNQTLPSPINPRGTTPTPSTTSMQSTVLPVPTAPSSHGLVPCGGTNQSPCKVTDIFVLIARVTNWLVSVAGLYAVYEIIKNGFWLVLSMGNEEAITTRKNGLTNAVVGFALVLFAFMIINTVVNVLLTRSIATTNNPQCRLNLTDPLTYLTINQDPCSSLSESIHQ